MGNGKQKQGVGPYLVGALVKLGIAGLVVVSLATPLAFIRAGLMGWALGRQFQGSVSETAIRLEAVLRRTINPVTNRRHCPRLWRHGTVC